MQSCQSEFKFYFQQRYDKRPYKNRSDKENKTPLHKDSGVVDREDEDEKIIFT